MKKDMLVAFMLQRALHARIGIVVVPPPSFNRKAFRITHALILRGYHFLASRRYGRSQS